LISFSDPEWIGRLLRGVRFVLFYTLVTIALTSLYMVMLLVHHQVAVMVVRLVQLGGYFIYVYGTWYMTMPDPGGLGEEAYGRSRKIVRIALAASAISQLLNLAQTAWNFLPEVELAARIVRTVCSFIVLVGTLAMLDYLSKLAARIPDEFLIRRARFLKLAIGIPYAALLVIILAIEFFVKSRTKPMMTTFGCSLLLIIILLLIFGTQFLLMLARFVKQLITQLKVARENWRGSGSVPN